MYEFKRRNTPAQALLMGAWLLVFTVLSFNALSLVVTPGYATFGNQYYMFSPVSVRPMSASGVNL